MDGLTCRGSDADESGHLKDTIFLEVVEAA